MNTITIPESFTPQTLAGFMLDHILQPEALQLWDQETWAGIPGESLEETAGTLRERLEDAGTGCGTTACIAGWASILTAPEGSVIYHDSGLVRPPGGILLYPQDVATPALGLSAWQAEWLFRASRTLDQVTAALEAIAEGDKNWQPSDFDPSEWEDVS